MKKRTVGLFLVFVMLCGLVAPAAAADTDPPLYRQWGYDTPQEMMEEWGFANVTYDWVTDRYQLYLAQLTLNPEAAFDRAYENWSWAMVDTYFSSREEFLRDAAMQLARLDAYDVYDAQEFAALVQLQYNGKAVSFPQAQPMFSSTCAMAPVRPLAEALGCEMEYFASTHVVQLTRGDCRVTLGRDGTVLNVWRNEQQSTVELDVPPYESEGQMYVPVRAVCEALGLQVGWDEEWQTVVILDRDAIVADIDRGFTILNQYLRPSVDAELTSRMAVEATATVTRFDTIDGDRVYPVHAEAVIQSGGQQVQMDLAFDLAALIQLVRAEFGEAGVWIDADDDAQLEKVQKLLEDGRLQLIFNLDEDTLYVKTDKMRELLAGYLPEDKVPQLAGSAWFKITDAGLSEWPGLPFGARGARTVGEYLYQNQCADLDDHASGKYQALMESVQAFRGVLGDQKFTKNGSTYSAKVDRSALDGVEDADLFGRMLQQFEGKLTFNEASGMRTFDFQCRAGMPLSGDILLTAEGHHSKSGGEARYVLHLKNQFKCEITVKTQITETDRETAAEPPEGSLVLDLRGLMDAWSSAAPGA